MLYNPNWKKVSLADFIGWLEGKKPLETYNPGNIMGRCLVGQYMASRDIAWEHYNKVVTELLGHARNRLDVLYSHPHTFGCALTRAKAFQKTKETA